MTNSRTRRSSLGINPINNNSSNNNTQKTHLSKSLRGGGFIQRIPLSEHNSNNLPTTSSDNNFPTTNTNSALTKDDRSGSTATTATSSSAWRQHNDDGLSAAGGGGGGGGASRIPRDPSSRSISSKRSLAPPAIMVQPRSPSSVSSRKAMSTYLGSVRRAANHPVSSDGPSSSAANHRDTAAGGGVGRTSSRIRAREASDRHIQRMSTTDRSTEGSAASGGSSKVGGAQRKRNAPQKPSGKIKRNVSKGSVKSFDPFLADDDGEEQQQRVEQDENDDDDGNRGESKLTNAMSELRANRDRAQSRRMERNNRRKERVAEPDTPSATFEKKDAEAMFPNNFPGEKGKEDFLTLTKAQLEQLVKQRCAGLEQNNDKGKDQEISRLKKEVEDLKFLQELDSDNEDGTSSGGVEGNSDISKVSPDKKKRRSENDNPDRAKFNEEISALKERYTKEIEQLKQEKRITEKNSSQLRAENAHINSRLDQIKQDNLSLKAVLEASSPQAISSPEAYKKALKLQGELHEARTTLQEESLCRERAETNLNCYKMEAETKLKDAEKREIEMRNSVSDLDQELQVGVDIMKGLEDEVHQAQQKVTESNSRVKALTDKIEELQNEQLNSSQVYESRIGKMTTKLKESEESFLTENMDLQSKCAQLEDEVKTMKTRVNEMEEKRSAETKEFTDCRTRCKELEKSLEESDGYTKDDVSKLQAKHHEQIREYEQSLDDKNDELKTLRDKIVVMDGTMAKVYAQNLEEESKTERKINDITADYKQQLEKAMEQEVELKEELQACVNELTEVHEINVSLEEEVKNLKDELVLGGNEIEDLKVKIEDLSSAAKQSVSSKAKEHTYMREKKKWSAVEKKLCSTVTTLEENLSILEQEYQQLLDERDEIDARFIASQKENQSLKVEVNTIKHTYDMMNMSKERNEEETVERIRTLEQELCRASSVSSAVPEQMLKFELALQRKNEELRHLHQQIESLQTERNQGNIQMGSSLRENNASSSLNTFGTVDEIMGACAPVHAGSWEDVNEPWDKTTVATSRVDNSRGISVEQPHPLQQERNRIEDDALRRYVRHRKTIRKGHSHSQPI